MTFIAAKTDDFIADLSADQLESLVKDIPTLCEHDTVPPDKLDFESKFRFLESSEKYLSTLFFFNSELNSIGSDLNLMLEKCSTFESYIQSTNTKIDLLKSATQNFTKKNNINIQQRACELLLHEFNSKQQQFDEALSNPVSSKTLAILDYLRFLEITQSASVKKTPFKEEYFERLSEHIDGIEKRLHTWLIEAFESLASNETQQYQIDEFVLNVLKTLIVDKPLLLYSYLIQLAECKSLALMKFIEGSVNENAQSSRQGFLCSRGGKMRILIRLKQMHQCFIKEQTFFNEFLANLDLTQMSKNHRNDAELCSPKIQIRYEEYLMACRNAAGENLTAMAAAGGDCRIMSSHLLGVAFEGATNQLQISMNQQLESMDLSEQCELMNVLDRYASLLSNGTAAGGYINLALQSLSDKIVVSIARLADSKSSSNVSSSTAIPNGFLSAIDTLRCITEKCSASRTSTKVLSTVVDSLVELYESRVASLIANILNDHSVANLTANIATCQASNCSTEDIALFINFIQRLSAAVRTHIQTDRLSRLVERLYGMFVKSLTAVVLEFCGLQQGDGNHVATDTRRCPSSEQQQFEQLLTFQASILNLHDFVDSHVCNIQCDTLRSNAKHSVLSQVMSIYCKLHTAFIDTTTAQHSDASSVVISLYQPEHVEQLLLAHRDK